MRACTHTDASGLAVRADALIKTWDIPVLMTFSDLYWDIQKLIKNRWDITGSLEIKQKQTGYPEITQQVTYPWICQEQYVCTDIPRLHIC